ncbi:hypothetical protein Fmac_006513 [Flemingia macrophylla]|uniref:Uncharacterized protein n=1 Tax=Flemingia macrophylla TaxID=520843 RepID=A0ABD1NCB4_9FABA
MYVGRFEKLDKNKRLVKKLAKKCHAFLASQAVIKQIPRFLLSSCFPFYSLLLWSCRIVLMFPVFVISLVLKFSLSCYEEIVLFVLASLNVFYGMHWDLWRTIDHILCISPHHCRE